MPDKNNTPSDHGSYYSCPTYRFNYKPPFREYALPLKRERGRPAEGTSLTLNMTVIKQPVILSKLAKDYPERQDRRTSCYRIHPAASREITNCGIDSYKAWRTLRSFA